MIKLLFVVSDFLLLQLNAFARNLSAPLSKQLQHVTFILLLSVVLVTPNLPSLREWNENNKSLNTFLQEAKIIPKTLFIVGATLSLPASMEPKGLLKKNRDVGDHSTSE